jgi:peptide chain release factor 2
MLGSKGRLLARLKRWSEWEGDLLAAIDMLRTENLSALSADDAAMLLHEMDHTAQSLLQESLQYELELLLSGPYDASDARLVITCGAGGTESNDWVSDLYRMYQRHCDKMGFRLIVEDLQAGDVTGYKSVELIVEGDNAYGWLQGEKGAHRLVRLSPFNANNKRQTTFAGVDVAPLLDETVLDIDVPESDLEITTMRAGGKGGQNVNKVNSAVRIKHLPSGLQVKCVQERSQSQNRDIALRRLKSQLLAIAQEQRVQEIAEIRGDQVEASWGAQIRNYVLHPYRLVKDARTGWESSNVQGFLDGDLEDCIGAYLRHKAKQEAEVSSAASHDGS